MIVVSYLACYNTLLQNATNIIAKCDSYFITKRNKVFHKMHLVFHYKMRRFYCKMWQFYYKMRRLLQNESIHLVIIVNNIIDLNVYYSCVIISLCQSWIYIIQKFFWRCVLEILEYCSSTSNAFVYFDISVFVKVCYNIVENYNIVFIPFVIFQYIAVRRFSLYSF